MTRPFIVGFLKVRNEACREGNITRCLENMHLFCDTIVACDDASTDGTDLILEEFFDAHGIPRNRLLRIAAKDQDFRKELRVKAQMLAIVHKLKPKWIWWQDADEVLPDPHKLLAMLVDEATEIDDPENPRKRYGGYRFPYVQLWRNGSYARTDDGFADGSFIKLWRWRPDLEFDIVDRTHHMQFPHNVGEIADAPAGMHVIHFGNFGKNLQLKAIQYHGGLGGVERHLDFEAATYKRLDYDYALYPNCRMPGSIQPQPFTPREKSIIRSMEGLRDKREWFTVVIPTYNRVDYLEEAIKSLFNQVYQKWIAIVLDDGSTDETPRLMHDLALLDPRVFYARHPKRGAVAMNEIGMRFACDATEWWTRLGSDDYFEPYKLLNDALALRHRDWCYGPYKVVRKTGDAWRLDETCNLPEEGRSIQYALLHGQFRVSWANIAARTSILRRVRDTFGSFGDPRLVNMEDFLLNSRLARFERPVFRARSTDDRKLMITYNDDMMLKAIATRHLWAHDAIWRVNPIGASSSAEVTLQDDILTRQIINSDYETEAKGWKALAEKEESP